LGCGADSSSRLTSSPSWRFPLIISGIVVALAAAAVAIALISMAGGNKQKKSTPSGTTTPPAASAPPATPAPSPTEPPSATNPPHAPGGASPTTPPSGPSSPTSPGSSADPNGLSVPQTGGTAPPSPNSGSQSGGVPADPTSPPASSTPTQPLRPRAGQGRTPSGSGSAYRSRSSELRELDRMLKNRRRSRRGRLSPSLPSPGSASGSWTATGPAWTVVLLSTRSRAEADKKAKAINATGSSAGVLKSDGFKSLRPGYWVVYSGQYPTKAQADSARARLAAKSPGAYSRKISRS
jgi:hypothetical protein